MLSAAGDLVEVEVEEAEAARDSEMRTGAIAHEATRQTVAHLGDAEAQATTAGVPAAAHPLGGESAIKVLPEVVPVDGGVVRAIQMLATGATAGIVAVVGIVADADDSAEPSVVVIDANAAWQLRNTRPSQKRACYC